MLAERAADYGASCAALCGALRDAGCFRFAQPSGGFFVWVRLPDGVRAAELLPVAQRLGVVFLPGPVCAPTAPTAAYEGYARLCFALLEPPLLVEGVRRLAAAVAEVQAHSSLA